MLNEGEPLLFSRKRTNDGKRQPLQRGQVWLIVKEASERAAVQVLALRVSKHGPAGERRPCTHIYFGMHVFATSCVRRRASHSSGDKQAGHACSRPTSPSATTRRSPSDPTFYTLRDSVAMRPEPHGGAPRYYAEQSSLTDAGPLSALFDGLPSAIPALVNVIQGLIIRPVAAERLGWSPPSEAHPDQVRFVRVMLQRLLERSRRATEHRSPRSSLSSPALWQLRLAAVSQTLVRGANGLRAHISQFLGRTIAIAYLGPLGCIQLCSCLKTRSALRACPSEPGSNEQDDNHSNRPAPIECATNSQPPQLSVREPNFARAAFHPCHFTYHPLLILARPHTRTAR